MLNDQVIELRIQLNRTITEERHKQEIAADQFAQEKINLEKQLAYFQVEMSRIESSEMKAAIIKEYEESIVSIYMEE